MFKVIELLTRKEGMTVEEFQRAWLERRGPAVARSKGLIRYVQFHPLAMAYRRGEPACDGMEALWFSTSEAAQAYCQARQEDPAISEIVGNTSRVHVLRPILVVDGSPAPGSIVNIIPSQRRRGMTREDFFHHWHTNHARIAGKLPGMTRYEQNPTEEIVLGEDRYDGVSLVWFDTFADLKSIINTPEHLAALADEPNFLEQGGQLPIVLATEHEIAVPPHPAG